LSTNFRDCSFYVLLYAWNRVPEGRGIDVTGVVHPELSNLIAKVLLEGVRNLLRRGLARSYVESDEDLTRPRGRMRISETLNRALMSRVQIACTVDDLSRDVLPNRIVKTTLERLTKTADIDAELRTDIAAVLTGLSDIRTIQHSARDFGLVQLHGNNASYGFLLRVCALAYEALLPKLGTDRFQFRDVTANAVEMGYIFQDFIRYFFEREQKQFDVGVEKYRWNMDHSVGHGHQLWPRMETDTFLFDGRRTIIIECKWTPNVLTKSRFGSRSLRGDHLRQLHAYMTQHKHTRDRVGTVEGLLLYPLTADPVDVAVTLDGQWFRVRTINFAARWQEIHAELLDLLSRSAPFRFPEPAALALVAS
jgi:5-methylcytosine-specific restriction enzyme subunit McrC